MQKQRIGLSHSHEVKYLAISKRRSTEHRARSTREIEILHEKKYSNFTNLLYILSLLITNSRLLRVREIEYYSYKANKGNRILVFGRVSVSELGKACNQLLAL